MSGKDLSIMEVYSGWEGYQQSLVSAIAPLSRENLRYRVAPERRSVGEIAAHIAFGRIDWFNRMGAPGSARLAEQVAPLMNANGQVVESVAENPQEIVRWLEASWRLVENVLTQWTVEDLSTTYAFSYWGKTYAISHQWTIWRIMAHDIHHGGQLSILLGEQGIEPSELGDNGGHIIEPPLAESG